MSNPTKHHRRRQRTYCLKNGICHWCGHHIPFKDSTMEHLLPKSKGGTNLIDNLALSCEAANSARGSMDEPPEFVVKACKINRKPLAVVIQ